MNIVISFGRMVPFSKGHKKLIEKVISIAKLLNADHEIILTHSHDKNRNPLSLNEKMQFAQRFFPGVKFSSTSSKMPTILNHVDRLFQEGYQHVTVVVGGDRVSQFRKLFDEYYENVDVISAGNRSPEELSGTRMREMAFNGDYNGFRMGVPSHLSENDIDELYLSVRRGMGKI